MAESCRWTSSVAERDFSSGIFGKHRHCGPVSTQELVAARSLRGAALEDEGPVPLADCAGPKEPFVTSTVHARMS
jgi:hypothetical protein